MKNYNNISGELVTKFADISILRYEVMGFENLTLENKLFVYHLSRAALWGRDIIYDQNGRYNLRIRALLESIYINYKGNRKGDDFVAFEEYLFRFWFSSGIHHHYSGDKFTACFTKEFIISETKKLWDLGICLFIDKNELETIINVIFSKNKYLKLTKQSGDGDLLQESSVNMYASDVRQDEVENFYFDKKEKLNDDEKEKPISFGLNSFVVKDENGRLHEMTYCRNGLYGEAISKICEELSCALAYAETESQKESILLLIEYYETGNLKKFDDFSCCWVKDNNLRIDFINGFIETYSDPISMRGSWESMVHIKDEEASKRSEIICNNAKWFEDHSPIDDEFKKEKPTGISASVVNVAILSGDCYPSSPIGVNLPNADWIRKEMGSKSISIENIHYSYDQASKDSGLPDAFIADDATLQMIRQYGHITDRLHTDMHECLGHGSGKLRKGVDTDALGAYSSVIEETRADLFALYFMADDKMVDLGLLPNIEAYKSCFYSYILNGKITQLTRIELGKTIEEAHMRNRALISNWILDNAGRDVLEINGINLIIHDYKSIRKYIGILLKEIQRIKSTGDKQAAKEIIEKYAINVDYKIHKEVLDIYNKLDISPYKGFVNPRYELVFDNYAIKDVTVSYNEGYAEQMIRYSKEYSTLPLDAIGIECLKNPLPLSDENEKTVRDIRESLRRSMDGIVAKSMRDKGLHYSINFGLTRQYILRVAKKLDKNYNLASYLISRDVRELKIIGQMLLPTEAVNYTTAKYLAIITSYNTELKDLIVMDLFDRCEDAPLWALDFLTEEKPYIEIFPISFSILYRSMKRGFVLGSDTLKDNLYDIISDTIENRDETYNMACRTNALKLLCLWVTKDIYIKNRFVIDEDKLKWRDGECEMKKDFYDTVLFHINENEF